MFQKGKEKMDSVSPNILNIIGPGTSVQGDLVSEGDIRIDGNITGNIEARSRLVIGESSVVTGNIQARHATVSGLVKGNISVLETLLLKPGARIEGDITADKLVIESGAQFNGNCNMTSAKREGAPGVTKTNKPLAGEKAAGAE
ncbi:MAG: bactofilin family protein [Bacteroidia bacterium]|jgi:cytoskeletal protein CcmA (bactofilin family)